MFEVTQPTRRMDTFQPIRVKVKPKPRKQHKRMLVFLGLIFVYFIAPLRTNVLLLGTDDSPERGSAGRTDTIILVTVVPLKSYIGMMSIPRDLWVDVQGVGEQRINTAYFYSEANQPGSGAAAAMGTVQENFDVPVNYYMVIRMLGLVSVIDALGGVDIKLNSLIGELPAGTHHLNGIQALAFARDRASSDDFSRIFRAQVLISGAIVKVASPSSWRDLPQFIKALLQTVDTNIPFWQFPRLITTMVMASFFGGVKSEAISREMVTPFVTSGGAQVLLPNWDSINPLLKDMFGK